MDGNKDATVAFLGSTLIRCSSGVLDVLGVLPWGPGCEESAVCLAVSLARAPVRAILTYLMLPDLVPMDLNIMLTFPESSLMSSNATLQ